MTKTRIVTADGQTVEADKFKEIFGRYSDAVLVKDDAVAEIREQLNYAKKKGLDKKAMVEARKWILSGTGAQGFIDYATTVLQYMRVLGQNVQLDLFSAGMERPLFKDDDVPPGAAAIVRAERALDDPAPGPAGDADGDADEVDTFRPVGAVAETVVATVAEMVEQNDAEEAAVSPEELMRAKLEGEADGRRGATLAGNPYTHRPQVSAAYEEGWRIGTKDYKPAGTDAAAPASNVAKLALPRGAKRGQPPAGFADKTPRMSASQAAKLLGGGGNDAA